MQDQKSKALSKSRAAIRLALGIVHVIADVKIKKNIYFGWSQILAFDFFIY